MLTVDFLAKPRNPIDQTALGLPHERVTFPASDGVRLSGWYVPSRNGSAVVLVHGGGGDRQGTIRHARMIAGAGYGVLMYDARGRGESAGHENAFGWEVDPDVRGAVSYLTARGIHRVGLLGLSTGAEAVVTEAASDPRVKAVVPPASRDAPPSDAEPPQLRQPDLNRARVHGHRAEIRLSWRPRTSRSRAHSRAEVARTLTASW